MRSRHAVILMGLFTLVPTVYAADAASGKALYDKHCFQCHDTSIHTRKESIIPTLSALRKRVTFCEAQAHAGWNAAQKEDVVTYLNTTFYKFKP